MSPISRKELIRRLRKLGFEGPFTGGKHDYMHRASDHLRLAVPRDDAKNREIGTELQKRIIREIGVVSKAWIALK